MRSDIGLLQFANLIKILYSWTLWERLLWLRLVLAAEQEGHVKHWHFTLKLMTSLNNLWIPRDLILVDDKLNAKNYFISKGNNYKSGTAQMPPMRKCSICWNCYWLRACILLKCCTLLLAIYCRTTMYDIFGFRSCSCCFLLFSILLVYSA